MISCGKNPEKMEMSIAEETSVPPYDTIAKDSFSAGAVSVDVARKIRMASQKYQDSLRENRKKIEAEQLAKKELEEKEKATKKLAEEKKKAENEAKAKKEKENKTAEIPVESVQNP